MRRSTRLSLRTLGTGTRTKVNCRQCQHRDLHRSLKPTHDTTRIDILGLEGQRHEVGRSATRSWTPRRLALTAPTDLVLLRAGQHEHHGHLDQGAGRQELPDHHRHRHRPAGPPSTSGDVDSVTDQPVSSSTSPTRSTSPRCRSTRRSVSPFSSKINVHDHRPGAADQLQGEIRVGAGLGDAHLDQGTRRRELSASTTASALLHAQAVCGVG